MLTSRSNGASRVTSWPWRSTRPSVGSSKPAIIRSVVVLPEPDGPSIEKNSPSRDLEIDAGDRDHVAVALHDPLEADAGASTARAPRRRPVAGPGRDTRVGERRRQAASRWAGRRGYARPREVRRVVDGRRPSAGASGQPPRADAGARYGAATAVSRRAAVRPMARRAAVASQSRPHASSRPIPHRIARGPRRPRRPRRARARPRARRERPRRTPPIVPGASAAPREVNIVARDYAYSRRPSTSCPGRPCCCTSSTAAWRIHEAVIGDQAPRIAWEVARGGRRGAPAGADADRHGPARGSTASGSWSASGQRVDVIWTVPAARRRGGPLARRLPHPGSLRRRGWSCPCGSRAAGSAPSSSRRRLRRAGTSAVVATRQR